MKKFKNTRNNIRNLIINDANRIKFQFVCVYAILFVVSSFMTIVNILTSKELLMYSTLIFAILCIINIYIAKISETGLKISSVLFTLEIISMFIFFIISGTPEGFSAIWICMLPSSGMLLLKRKKASLICLFLFLILIFFFETPYGMQFLNYPYTQSFKLRFPMLFVAFFIVSFLLETIRSMTYDELKRARENYEYLYEHDALTGLKNRYGFNIYMEKMLNSTSNKGIALLMLDIDHFKNINDKYGHINGDTVLKKFSDFLKHISSEQSYVCRWGGEEFAILSPFAGEAAENAQYICDLLSSFPIKLDKDNIYITVSIGVAISHSNKNITADQLLKCADKCLFKAKDAGRNCIKYEICVSDKNQEI